MVYETITKFGWDQAKGKVKIYITSGLDGVGSIPKDNVVCEFEDTKLDLRIQDLNGKNFRLRIPELHNKIDIALSKFNIKSNGITITLQKEAKDDGTFERWTDLKPKTGMISKDVDKAFENNK